MDSVVFKACRICLNNHYTDFASFDDGAEWSGMYVFCFDLKLSNKDIPRKICSVCVEKMKEFTQFKKLAQKSDKLWKRIRDLDQKECKESKTDVKLDENIESEVSIIDTFDQYGDNQVSESELSVNDEEIDCKEGQDVDRNEFTENKIDAKLNHEIEENVFCDKCKMRFKYYSCYEIHLQKKDCGIQKLEKTIDLPQAHLKLKYPCGLCDMQDLTWDDLKTHLGKHRENFDMSCKLCKYVGRDFADMVAHRHIHTNPKYSSKICYVCHRKCRNPISLQFHFRKVHLRNEFAGWCSVCDKKYSGHKGFTNHVILHHYPNFICDHCGRAFLIKKKIIDHLKDCCKNSAFVCDMCGKYFSRQDNFTRHQQAVHDDVSVSCKHCNKSFKNQLNLDLHLRLISKKKEHQCHVCSKEFYTPSSLKIHMICHEERRLYSCDICGKSFKAEKHLTIHKRTHSGYKPHQCPFCPAAFTTTHQLKVHLSVHSGKRQYQCPNCDRSFHKKRLLREHCVKSHDGTNVKESCLKTTGAPGKEENE